MSLFSRKPKPVDLSKMRRKRRAARPLAEWRRLALRMSLLVVMCFSLFYAYTGYLVYRMNQIPQSTRDLLSEIAKVHELPQGEFPRIATVTNASSLPKDPLLMNTQNGDKVLVFCASPMTVIFRPSTGVVVNSAPEVLAGSCP